MILKTLNTGEPPVHTIFAIGLTEEAIKRIDAWEVPTIMYVPTKLVPEKILDQELWSRLIAADAHMVVMWFSNEDLNAMSLAKVGGFLEMRSACSLFIGCDPDYFRKSELETLCDVAGDHSPVVHLELDTLMDDLELHVLGHPEENGLH